MSREIKTAFKDGELFVSMNTVLGIIDACIEDFKKSSDDDFDFKESIVCAKAIKEIFLRDLDPVIIKEELKKLLD